MTDLHYLSAVDVLRMFRTGELSPVELVSAVIARAEATEPVVNAFAETFYEQALAAAADAEARYAGRGAKPRPLDGLPVAVKEEAPIAGQRNTLGSVPLRDAVADQTAVFVQRTIDAGGIVHARSTTPEFCCAPFTWTKLWGVTRNPWHTAYSPGGSSGGSAAALAAGSTTLATGSDIGGSIRIPAAFCGVTGFKPPYGRVPEVEVFNLDHYCHEGPMARSVADCALLQNVIAGPHPSDVASLRPKLEIPSRLDGIRGLRIALSVDLGCYAVDDDVAANTRAAAERLRDAGATVTEVALPWQREMINRAARIHFGMIFGPSVREIHAAHADELTSYARRFVAEAAARGVASAVVSGSARSSSSMGLSQPSQRDGTSAVCGPACSTALVAAKAAGDSPASTGTFSSNEAVATASAGAAATGFAATAAVSGLLGMSWKRARIRSCAEVSSLVSGRSACRARIGLRST